MSDVPTRRTHAKYSNLEFFLSDTTIITQSGPSEYLRFGENNGAAMLFLGAESLETVLAFFRTPQKTSCSLH